MCVCFVCTFEQTFFWKSEISQNKCAEVKVIKATAKSEREICKCHNSCNDQYICTDKQAEVERLIGTMVLLTGIWVNCTCSKCIFRRGAFFCLYIVYEWYIIDVHIYKHTHMYNVYIYIHIVYIYIYIYIYLSICINKSIHVNK